jgi:hypothetical protein
MPAQPSPTAQQQLQFQLQFQQLQHHQQSAASRPSDTMTSSNGVGMMSVAVGSRPQLQLINGSTAPSPDQSRLLLQRAQLQHLQKPQYPAVPVPHVQGSMIPGGAAQVCFLDRVALTGL